MRHARVKSETQLGFARCKLGLVYACFLALEVLKDWAWAASLLPNFLAGIDILYCTHMIRNLKLIGGSL